MKTFKSEALGALHETVQGFHEAGLVDSKTMRRFDKSCLVPVQDLTPGDIVETRAKLGVSQAVFAQYLRVTTGVVSKWERGDKHPNSANMLILDLVRRKGLEVLT